MIDGEDLMYEMEDWHLHRLLSVFFFSDVFCGYLLCTNIGRNPRIGIMKGDITPASFNHQGRLVDCR